MINITNNKNQTYQIKLGSWIKIRCPWGTTKFRNAQVLQEPIEGKKIEVHVLTNSNKYNSAQTVTLENGESIKVKKSSITKIKPKLIQKEDPNKQLSNKDIFNIYSSAKIERQIEEKEKAKEKAKLDLDQSKPSIIEPVNSSTKNVPIQEPITNKKPVSLKESNKMIDSTKVLSRPKSIPKIQKKELTKPNGRGR